MSVLVSPHVHKSFMYVAIAENSSMITLLLTLLACTDNQRSRAFGGTMTVQIPCDQQVFDVTWKGEDLWYATQPAPSDWKPEQKRFTEYSSYGLVQGRAVLMESRCSS